MVAQILTHTRQILPHVDANLLELCRRTNAREQEQMWRANGAAAHHDLVPLDGKAFPAALDFDPNGSATIKQQTAGHNVRP